MTRRAKLQHCNKITFQNVMLIFNGGLCLDSMPDDTILVLVSRHFYQGLGIETWRPRYCSRSRDLVTKISVLS